MSEIENPTRPNALAPPTELQFVPALLSVGKLTRALIGLKLAERGFHNGQDEMLIALDETARISVTQMSDVLGVRPSTVSKMLDRLIEKGLVKRVNHLTDARKTMLEITSTGLDVRSELLNMREKIDTELVAALPGNAESTLQSLENFAAVLKQRLNRLR